MGKIFILIFFAFALPCFAQHSAPVTAAAAYTASCSATLNEAMAVITAGNTAIGSAAAGSLNEIIILADIILDEPLIIEDGVHLRLVAGNADVTIQRGGNNLSHPVIWIRGENAVLHLGKPEMENNLFIDGGFLSDGIYAYAPLAALSGPGAKLYMYNNVFLQNNYNKGNVPGNSHFQNGAGVNIRTFPEDSGRQAEFIMKGGTIRGNTNDVLSRVVKGGGVLIRGFGIFTMEGGIIMDNTALMTGGGFHTDSRGTFNKTGGIIYGANAPAGYRNTAIEGMGKPPSYGHAVSVAVVDHQFFQYRNDSIAENENLSYTGAREGNGVFGAGEKWDTSDKDIWQRILVIVLIVFAVSVPVFLIVWRFTFKKQLDKKLKENPAPVINLEIFGLSPREKEICKLLLTDLSLKQVAYALKISNSGVNFHIKNLYSKLNIHSRRELMVKFMNQHTMS
ncbi:MAG: LuxR C-terminal-related transcriptional regulator [Treponema sp.]|nr:LuxR C-terminal-related transcriptional regulator [Treponema sp.]